MRASYFDLGIMHQTVFNTYKALMTADITRILELTDPHGSGEQITRIGIHNDVLMGFIAPLYVIHSGPETLLLVQTAIIASGALALYFIVRHLIAHVNNAQSNIKEALSIVVPLAYLMYFPLQRVNLYEFHAVALSIGFLLWMYSAYLARRWRWCILFGLSALLSKEQVGMSISIFVIVEVIHRFKAHLSHHALTWEYLRSFLLRKSTRLLLFTFIFTASYSLLSVYVFIPFFRIDQQEHFALHYYTQDGSDILNLLSQYFSRLVSFESVQYSWVLLFPVLFLPLLSIYFLPAISDLLINLLSNNSYMRNTYFHYTAVLIPWFFIALSHSFSRILQMKNTRVVWGLMGAFCVSIMIASARFGPLPYSTSHENSLWFESNPNSDDIHEWQRIVNDDTVAVSTTGKLAPHFSGRRFFYDFGVHYDKAQYVIVQPEDMPNYWNKDVLYEAYNTLQADARYALVHQNNNFEVYKRMSPPSP